MAPRRGVPFRAPGRHRGREAWPLLTGRFARADDPAMTRGLDIHVSAVIVGLFVDQTMRAPSS